MGPLTGKVAVVTGASRGLGRSIAFELASSGAQVAVNYNTSAEPAMEVARCISSDGSRAVTVQADVSREEDVRRMVDEVVQEFGGVDILVNNAGINRDRTLRKMTSAEWHEVMRTNLDSVFYCTQAVVPHMSQRGGGVVVNMSSIIGRMGNVGQANYAASKAGMIGFTKAAARELARDNIRVVAVCPGFVETDMLAGVPEQARERLLTQVPLGRFGKPGDVARLVRFLCSEAGWMTGAILDLNGGHYIPS